MLQFVTQKMLSKKWMVLALLIGNILLISIAAANPMYTEAVLQRTLNTDISNYIEDTNKYPMTMTIRGSGYSNQQGRIAATEQELRDSGDKYGMPLKELVTAYTMAARTTTTNLYRKDRCADIGLGAVTDLEQHIELVAGTMPAAEPDENGFVDVVVSEKGMQAMKLLLGEELVWEKYVTADGEPLKARIAGVFKEKDSSDPYWVVTPSYYANVVLFNSDFFYEQFVVNAAGYNIQPAWYVLYDYSDIRVRDVARILETLDYYVDYFDGITSQTMKNNFGELLTNFRKTEKKVRTTFLVLEFPVFVLLAAFIFMVSRQLLDMEQSEISVIKSRGASRRQIIGVYLLQSLITVSISFVISMFLSVFLVRVLGAASAFLEFVQRKALLVELRGTALLYALGAAVFSICTMVVPVFKHSRVTIVNHKQKKNSTRAERPLWQRLFLDVILLGISLYGLFSFNAQKDILAQAVIEGNALDPLLFLSSSLFMVGAGLLALRIIPLLTTLVFRVNRENWSPALYTSFVRVIRTRRQQGFIMAFLVMTIALGVFNASAARTINNNDERNLEYMTGTDLVIEEKWKDNSLEVADAAAAGETIDLVYTEPDFGRYEVLEGIEQLTKVYQNTNTSVSLSSGTLQGVSLMAIDTKAFGETASMEDGLLPSHWYNYLNAMSQTADAVLLSDNFRDYGYKINDVIYYRVNDETLRGVVYGFVEYWPGYASVTYRKGTDGVYAEKDNYMIVSNLAPVQVKCGVLPYQVWIKTTGSTQFIYDFIEENSIELNSFTDLAAEKVKHKNDAVLQGTNGILTVGFIVALVICAVGFLIYWILSIKSRELQFGIFRAMGMSMKEIIGMLLNEHLFISGTSIAAGALVGWLTARLFMPLIQIAYSTSENVLPLMVVSETGDNVRLAVIVGLMILLCMGVLAWIIKEMKIAQALKLGED